MGLIRASSTGKVRVLESEHLVGRGPVCTLRLEEQYVSAQHAELRWTGGAWLLKDLGSRNGTYHNQIRLKPGEECTLGVGSRIAFGKVEQSWVVVDDSAPQVMAVPLAGGDPVLSERDLLALPSNDDPRATIHRAGGTWVIEDLDGTIAPIPVTREFEVAGRKWRFSCPEASAPTVLDVRGTGEKVRDLKLFFSVSRDEEHVDLRVQCGGRAIDMGSRGHNYLLLTLARRRQADAARGAEEAESGWIAHSELAHDPAMAPPKRNIDIFRIRQQFMATGVSDAPNIIEHDARSKRLRLGTARISITTL